MIITVAESCELGVPSTPGHLRTGQAQLRYFSQACSTWKLGMFEKLYAFYLTHLYLVTGTL